MTHHKRAASGLETKFAAGPQFKFAESDDGAMTVKGYASRFGEIDAGADSIERGAYAAGLMKMAEQGQRVKMLWQHDPSQVIGVWDEVAEDEIGLGVSGRLLKGVRLADEAAILVKAGAMDGLSIGYSVRSADRTTVDDQPVRVLKELDLWEVSLVTFPMQRSARLQKDVDWSNPRSVEALLRDAGASHKEAKRIVSAGVQSGPRDADWADDADTAALVASAFDAALRG